MNNKAMKIHRIRSTDGSGTLCYLVEDPATKKAAVIDANLNDVEEILSLIRREGLDVVAILDTHTHADHKSGAGRLREALSAPYLMHPATKDKSKIVELGKALGIGEILRANTEVVVDQFIDEGDRVPVGGLQLRVMATPGHTDNHLSFVVEDAVFTGDLLLIGQAGRSDLPGGDPSAQYDSLYNKIAKLPQKTRIFPGHDYEDHEFSLLSDELKTNPFLTRSSKEDFVSFVREYFPPVTDIGEDGHIVLQCGTTRIKTAEERYTDISAVELSKMLALDPDLLVLDVREPFELMAFGAIHGVRNIPSRALAARLSEIPKDRDIVVVCQSGGRSSEAAHLLVSSGFGRVFNLLGGTGGWVNQGFPYVRRTTMEEAL